MVGGEIHAFLSEFSIFFMIFHDQGPTLTVRISPANDFKRGGQTLSTFQTS